MFHDGWDFWGMHLLWWLFWIVAIMALFSPFTPVPCHRWHETPFELLARRYAAGEISSEEY